MPPFAVSIDCFYSAATFECHVRGTVHENETPNNIQTRDKPVAMLSFFNAETPKSLNNNNKYKILIQSNNKYIRIAQ